MDSGGGAASPLHACVLAFLLAHVLIGPVAVAASDPDRQHESARYSQGGSPDGHLVEAQADETPAADDDTRVRGKRLLKGTRLPSTDSSDIATWLLPLVVAAGLTALSLGIAALSHARHAEDEEQLARLVERRGQQGAVPLPATPPERQAPLAASGQARIAAAWEVVRGSSLPRPLVRRRTKQSDE